MRNASVMVQSSESNPEGPDKCAYGSTVPLGQEDCVLQLWIRENRQKPEGDDKGEGKWELKIKEWAE